MYHWVFRAQIRAETHTCREVPAQAHRCTDRHSDSHTDLHTDTETDTALCFDRLAELAGSVAWPRDRPQVARLCMTVPLDSGTDIQAHKQTPHADTDTARHTRAPTKICKCGPADVNIHNAAIVCATKSLATLAVQCSSCERVCVCVRLVSTVFPFPKRGDLSSCIQQTTPGVRAAAVRSVLSNNITRDCFQCFSLSLLCTQTNSLAKPG